MHHRGSSAFVSFPTFTLVSSVGWGGWGGRKPVHHREVAERRFPRTSQTSSRVWWKDEDEIIGRRNERKRRADGNVTSNRFQCVKNNRRPLTARVCRLSPSFSSSRSSLARFASVSLQASVESMQTVRGPNFKHSCLFRYYGPPCSKTC